MGSILFLFSGCLPLIAAVPLLYTTDIVDSNIFSDSNNFYGEEVAPVKKEVITKNSQKEISGIKKIFLVIDSKNSIKRVVGAELPIKLMGQGYNLVSKKDSDVEINITLISTTKTRFLSKGRLAVTSVTVKITKKGRVLKMTSLHYENPRENVHSVTDDIALSLAKT